MKPRKNPWQDEIDLAVAICSPADRKARRHRAEGSRMTEDLSRLIRNAAASVDGKTVIVELICSDEYGAQVLFDDVVSRIASEGGLVLKLRGKRAE
ncbi:hypothetical protein [Bradyrhizobium sp.]|uniref:hypothetical protein n=1 Tax=Bradyrhizobium sp. TaxID=376 RepID=UPI003C33DD40